MGEELHCLEVSVGGELGERYIVSPLGLKIGRTVSGGRRAGGFEGLAHALHGRAQGRTMLFVSDLNSTNGTFVDGQRVTGAAILPVGSVLTVGHFRWCTKSAPRADL